MVGQSFQCPTEAKETSTFDLKNTKTDSRKTIDLHTATSLIGTLDGLDLTLYDLGLHEYATKGVLTLYSVVRAYQDGDNNDRSVGKEEIFRYCSSWVIVLT
jgi:hypothetical protein